MSAVTTTPSNGSNVNGALTANTSSNISGGRPQLKMSSSSKGADAARKQAASPVNGGQRKPPSQKAWTQGTNPITQRPSNLSTPNGVVSPKHTQNPSAESASPMKHLNDRLYFLLASCVGLPAEITLKNAEKYTGVLSGTSLDPTEMRYVFKMVKRMQSPSGTQTNGTGDLSDEYVGHGDSHVMAFDIGDVADFHCPGVGLDKSQVKTPNGIASGFRTDTDISGNLVIRERNLQKWEPSADSDINHSLESSGRTTEWDQFSTNEQLFGVKSNYDESYYTTTIDRTNPQYAERAARAEKIAREIEASSSLNAHVREERGHTPVDDKGQDEEDKYSGVRRDFPALGGGGPNKYTPPARRPPTGQPTVAGAPVDPAIISSQLARPDSATAMSTQRAVSPPQKRTTPEPSQPEAATAISEVPASSKSDLAKDAAPKNDTKDAAPTKPAAEQTQKKPTLSQIRPGNTSVEQQVLESFKQFSAGEKMRISDRQRSMARESKAVKLNDLRKFSQNFKLNTPVPTDLVPILAKDETKQQMIVEKALRSVQEQTASAQSTPVTANAKMVPRPTAVKPESTHPSPSATVDRQQTQRPRPGHGQYQPASMRDRAGPNQNIIQGGRGQTGLLGTRLAINQQQHKQQGAIPYNNIPHPMPIQDSKPDLRAPIPTGPSATSSGVQTPTSGASTRFNVKAHEFKPNPAANTFQPGGNPSAGSSPRPGSAPKQDAPPKITSFYKNQRPKKEPLKLDQTFSPIKRLMEEPRDDNNKTREFANNGGVPLPFRTPPTWDFPTKHTEKGYIAMFENTTVASPISAPHNIIGNGPIPHQHQLPLHLQQVPQPQSAQHTPRHPPVQPHHNHGGGPHFDGHQMQFSHSTSSVHPSPRTMPPFMYSTQPQPGFPQQPPMQSYGMSPVIPHAGLRQQGGHQFMNPPVPGMGGHMMTNQPSNGPYMGMPANQQVPMYAPAPGPGYANYPNQMSGPPGPNGYPSPRHGAPMMQHQGSQQGHQQPHIVYMQNAPMFAQMPPASMVNPMGRQPYAQSHHPQHQPSPQQHHQFPQHAHRGTPSGSYSQPMMQQHSMPPQGPPPTGPANHGQEGNDEVK